MINPIKIYAKNQYTNGFFLKFVIVLTIVRYNSLKFY